MYNANCSIYLVYVTKQLSQLQKYSHLSMSLQQCHSNQFVAHFFFCLPPSQSISDIVGVDLLLTLLDHSFHCSNGVWPFTIIPLSTVCQKAPKFQIVIYYLPKSLMSGDTDNGLTIFYLSDLLYNCMQSKLYKKRSDLILLHVV